MDRPRRGSPGTLERAFSRQLTCFSVRRASRLPLSLHPDGASYDNYRARFECKRRQHRAKLVNGQRIVAVHQHMPAPLADPHYEQAECRTSHAADIRRRYR